jgi:restriction endonuclease S subunit
MSPGWEDRILITNQGEIEGRIDPHFYKPEFIQVDREIKNLKYATKQVKDFAKVICGPFGSSIKVKDYGSSGVPLIRIANIDENHHLTLENTIFISEDLAKMLKPYEVKKEDLIISQRGTLGMVAKVPSFFENAIISANFIAVKDIKDVSPSYLQTFLTSRFGRIQLSRRTSGQVQTKITTDDIKTIKVPVPPQEIQERIIQIMENAYSQKKQKEEEAENLINSIEDYFIDKLGIELPDVKDKMCFASNSNELINNRFDPYYHQPGFKEVEKVLEQGRFKVVLFRDLVTDIQNGVEIRKYVDKGYRYLRVTDLGEYEINDNDPRFVDIYEIPQRIKLTKRDFLVSRSGTLGLVSAVTDKIVNTVLSSHIFKVSLDDKINPEYLEVYFRSPIGKSQFFQKNNGAIVPEINQAALKSLKVILPPIEIQNQIAEEVKEIMRMAKQLKEEAKVTLERAKEQVERVIIGENGVEG